MSALAKSAVTLYGADWRAQTSSVFHMRQEELVNRRLTLVLTGQGGQTNTIGAAALGFDKLIGCSNLWDATNAKGYPAVIDPVNNILILLDGSAAPAPVDVTTTVAYITVWGITTVNPTLS